MNNDYSNATTIQKHPILCSRASNPLVVNDFLSIWLIIKLKIFGLNKKMYLKQITSLPSLQCSRYLENSAFPVPRACCSRQCIFPSVWRRWRWTSTWSSARRCRGRRVARTSAGISTPRSGFFRRENLCKRFCKNRLCLASNFQENLIKKRIIIITTVLIKYQH